MKIYQVLNNNVCTVLENGEEIIVIGTGIGFKKKPQDEIEEKKIQKKFFAASNTLTEQLLKLMRETPPIYLDVVTQIIERSESQLNIELNMGIYLTLCDHISFAIERYTKGLKINNAFLWDVKKLYSKEFSIGMEAVHLINKKLKVELDENEAAFIAIHLMNAEFNVGLDLMDSMNKIINEVIKIIQYSFKLDLDEDSLVYLRLINHLKFFAQRVLSDTPYDNNETLLLDVVKSNYYHAYLCALSIKEYVKLQYECDISDEEVVYLSIHIQRLIDYKK